MAVDSVLKLADHRRPDPAVSDQPEPIASRHQLLLATWLSPAFPVGAFSYSHGLETAIADGRLPDAASLADWVGLLVERGSGWCDAVLLAEAWRAAGELNDNRLAAAADLAAAMAPSRERAMETLNLGAAFLKAVIAGWPRPALLRFNDALAGESAYPVAVGAAAAAHAIALPAVLAQFLNAFAANLISVAVRLVPLGQSDGLAVLSQLQPLVLTTADRAAASSLDDFGSAAIASDIASMRHETLYSRVFRS
jgi:urease accessory protein